jgi:hypothetical protein
MITRTNFEQYLLALASGDYVRRIAIWRRCPREDALTVACLDMLTEISAAFRLLRGRHSSIKCLVINEVIISCITRQRIRGWVTISRTTKYHHQEYNSNPQR